MVRYGLTISDLREEILDLVVGGLLSKSKARLYIKKIEGGINFMRYELPIFGQLNYFAGELLRMIDEGQMVSVEEVCDNIEKGTIVQFIKTRCGFKIQM